MFRMFETLKRLFKAKRISGEATDLKIDAELLCCQICYEIFADSPRCLPCGHSLCCSCLSRLQSGREETFQCPICRKELEKRRRFPKNYAVEAILNSVDEWVANELNQKHHDENCERITILRLKKKVEELSSENSKLKKEIQVSRKRYFVRIVLASLMAAIVAFVLHRYWL
ncbi:RING-type domain-containing protein [Aphelenchoides bicaudatus]|nr:RING-type domain-containing protein [Aphelenchoides bicaudatus]